MVTKSEFKQIVSLLTSAYQKFEISAETDFNVWYAALRDIPLIDLKEAAVEHIKTVPYVPTIAGIRNIVYPQVKSYQGRRYTKSQWLEIENKVKMKQLQQRQQLTGGDGYDN